MSTTSNSRADALTLILLFAFGCATASTAPDAPLTAAPDAPQAAVAQPVRSKSAAPDFRRLELATVRVRSIDNELAKFVSPQLLRTWRDPVAVEATTTTDLPSSIGNSSPALIINDEIYVDTWQVRPNRLIAFVPDRARLRDRNKAETIWIGGGNATRSREAITFPMPGR